MLHLSFAGWDLLNFACAAARPNKQNASSLFGVATKSNIVECCVMPHNIFAWYTIYTCAFATWALCYTLSNNVRISQVRMRQAAIQQQESSLKMNQHLNGMQSRSWDLLYFKMILTMTHFAPQAEGARAQKSHLHALRHTQHWAEPLNQRCCCNSAR